jgi:hypothetical protein
LGEKSVWLEILLMVLWHVHCLSCIWPKADKTFAGRAVRKVANIRNTTICCRLFQIGFSSSDAIECSGFLLQNLRLHLLILQETFRLWGCGGREWVSPLLLPTVHSTKRLQALATQNYRCVRKAAKSDYSFVLSVRPSVRLHGTTVVKISRSVKIKQKQ